MSSESRLYTFSTPTKDKLRKFRLSTSRAKDPQAVICETTPVEELIDALPVAKAMLYAGAKELMRNESEAGKVIEIDDAEDLLQMEQKLKGEE
ncbi:hypothetical protein B0A48_16411 [Cryoendolithus antarcticus]|uniref:ADF-H domain-containing protein n=1 Tax=Cryoendolithus antarcticus TaxID=1507870 RepID=A0A1V8SE93_9PEZI|nr:hypothetical protein B0A48_16411 [Cryoendolithus antarcticus]